MSVLTSFRTNRDDIQGLNESGLNDALDCDVNPSSVGFDIGKDQNTALLALASGCVDGVDSRGKALAQHNQDSAEKEQRAKKDNFDLVYLLILQDQIHAFEDDLASKYGENFAEDMFADLHQQGLISQEDFDRIMAIEDQNERRQAIAVNIQEGLDKGTITENDLADRPWDVRKWMDMRVEEQALVARDSVPVLEGKVGVDTVESDVKSSVTYAFNSNAPPQDTRLLTEAKASQEADRDVEEVKPFQPAFPIA